MKLIQTMAAVAMLMLSVQAMGAGYYTVSEPKPSARRIELSLMHPMAQPSVVKKFSVDSMTAGQVRKLLLQHKGLWQDASISCRGGYNPLVKDGAFNDQLAFDIASTKGDSEAFAQFVDTRSMHEVCMAKALSLAERLNRDRN